MMENQEGREDTGAGSAGKSEDGGLPLDTITQARTALAILTNRFLRGEIAEGVLRASVYAVNGLGKLLVHEKAKELEGRIRLLEERSKP
jgi:hypothetical protein